MDPLKICFLASEVVPFAKTGGLADVSGALAKYLDKEEHDIRVFMPFYSSIDTSVSEFHKVDFIQDIQIQFGNFSLTFSLLTAKLPDSNANVYFVHCPGLFDRGSIYTDDMDEYLRFALLTRASIESCQRMGWAPDIMHCNDWQTGLAPLYLKTLYSWDDLFAKTRTILTIHNIGYQGIFGWDKLDTLGINDYKQFLPAEDLDAGIINYMKIGLLHADMITTVSNTYAKEIMTSEYGCGLEGLLQQRQDRLIGIVNGVDYAEWSPESDKLIPHAFNINDLSGKEKNKQALLKKMSLPYNATTPVCGIVSRLTGQKGFELLHESLFEILASTDIQFVVLGSGEEKYAHFFQQAQAHFPHKMVFFNGYNVELSHLIEAGSDMFLMPSRYEPCGLNQIYSLKYGTVPIVRKTGGLADTVDFYDWESQQGTGFVFEHFNADSVKWAINHAVETYKNRDAWTKLMKAGMEKNFSWDVQVQKYIELYRWLVG